MSSLKTDLNSAHVVNSLFVIMIFIYMYQLSLDNCKKLGLVFENVVGIVEIINSKAIQLQVRTHLQMVICLLQRTQNIFYSQLGIRHYIFPIILC